MKIAIVKLSAMGDIIHAMIVLQFIKKYNRDISIDWFVEDGFKDVVQFHPDIKQVHSINFRKAKKKKSLHAFFTEIKKVRLLDTYDLVIDMQGLIKSAILSYFIPSRVTIGFDKFSIREKYASIFYDKRFSFGYEENIILRNVELINFALGCKIGHKQIQNKSPYLYSFEKYVDTDLSKTKKNIIIISGASFKAKMYPTKKFVKLIDKIDANFLVIWGSELEKKIAYEIQALSPHIKVVEKIRLNSLISLISQVDLVVGSDTGPTHMAWALNVPSIILFGPTSGDRNSYKTINNQIIESDSEVNPFKINKEDFSIKDIEVDLIVQKSEEILNCL
jgi:heptosyltransferase I